MYLKRLELSGFKSFAKQTIFEFLTSITAIVGPNGAGKSNVAEAIRWVLGEQSLKTLRGKRGEDFIFSGSSKAPRLGRASASLVFDNMNKKFSIAFDEVIITRRVTRDGANQYLINGSQVRLKDIAELLSRVGLGSTQHHIISQGESDRILLASPEERKEMIEDALGLKGYHIKRDEAVKKMEATEENIKQVKLIQKEINPHLKYLRKQAEKMRNTETLRENLIAQFRVYITREERTIQEARASIAEKKNPLLKKHDETLDLLKYIQETAKAHEDDKQSANAKESVERSIQELQARSRSLERELGRIEGKLDDVGVRGPEQEKSISAGYVQTAIGEFIQFINIIVSRDNIEDIKADMKKLKTRMHKVLGLIDKMASPRTEMQKSLQKEREQITRTLAETADKLQQLLQQRETAEELYRKRFVALRDDERKLRLKERDLDEIRKQLKEFDFELEKIRLLENELSHLKGEASRFFHATDIDISSAQLFADEDERVNERKKLDKLRIKMEESGAIDMAVLKEYEEVSERDSFLTNQLDDLVQALKSLRSLVKELTEKLEREFQEGVDKINTAFQEFFDRMFGGGRAEIKTIEQRKYTGKEKEENTSEDVLFQPSLREDSKSGIEVSVSIPGKRIHSLAMLSGGERALTSIALLFAMSAVNPPPFLVLDETDAALDEANSQRYATLLKNLSKKTQLIVITHNRETMRAAGVLYGVTIGGEGISKLLSLQFEQALEVAE
ncbi:MAG: hypothetical protein A3C80_02755 [Candidatus Ryanbacteria bacterium RIFCSPHIGHO2_02_FULL_45_43]|uniref:RecF/RecN/SMC N-terminal domain-containing protein n=1 Tax=Candidatus Ryanbacteria bacterium RIFCSPHIGHO2_01_45_13 TaxID=1802112 RepID=A0A1G2G092_9BACT|nr:MAG: hypothetical protein A2718_01170 [Candidatus Ryanbacteria bacterium RIFCSPHIGHO2_01_FULL_44_130]OGZ43517.1 MAG: hypothetical protein A2W41_04245 [Candidatus Ryanbacteria bacterium RIFCSPHIGHO2_01_45_13]OGZ47861.1 MAG: hypothetical protein A3C80_02755 [Candidatus Ryanbacteria bacterium RIFCSPHIGHO2_02_FULL_45_43]OGZ49906.1 MAG: hypothetical protein A3E55_03790 [Candidatus Ryanbacteria bacterium RIFCSPHIGHO2_12_FULL_44_20]OGZ51016.1 MAG: hypothetical protein A3A17_03330 [Candidatus Ryanba